MSTLRSVDPGAEQTLDVVNGGYGDEVFIMLNHRDGGGSIHVSYKELLAALGIEIRELNA